MQRDKTALGLRKKVIRYMMDWGTRRTGDIALKRASIITTCLTASPQEIMFVKSFVSTSIKGLDPSLSGKRERPIAVGNYIA